jgi:hypothetical protein
MVVVPTDYFLPIFPRPTGLTRNDQRVVQEIPMGFSPSYVRLSLGFTLALVTELGANYPRQGSSPLRWPHYHQDL